MDIFKILLLYMAFAVTGTAQQVPSLTPPPATPAPIVTPAPATPIPTEAPLVYDTLRPGSSGPEVEKLQERLIALGYLTGKADGRYGQQTKAAVSAFQEAYGLQVDGIAGNQTQALLFSPGTPKTPVPTATVIPAVLVHVYYMDADTGSQLHEMAITCYGSTTIYANGNLVPEGYRPAGETSAAVTVENGTAAPASVTFFYTAQKTAAETPWPAE